MLNFQPSHKIVDEGQMRVSPDSLCNAGKVSAVMGTEMTASFLDDCVIFSIFTLIPNVILVILLLGDYLWVEGGRG